MRNFKFAPLYELSNRGSVKCWLIEVEECGEVSKIITSFGVLNGKMQVSSDTISSGKNIGKVNETSVYEQALAEAKSKWEGKKKKGYVESLEGAKAGDLDALITGGVEPMLAHTYAKSGDKITYPAYTQPKLDGIRCVAIKSGEEVTLWTRTRKPILSCPHIVEAIAITYAGVNITLDGELYNHSLKSNFEEIVAAVKRDEATEASALIEYHIYDIISDEPFNVRSESIGVLEAPLVGVKTELVNDESAMLSNFDSYTELGYEGLMIRTERSPYENKRSYHLQKVKEFDDAEFLIVGVNEGRGKLQGTLGTFSCVTNEGVGFEVKMGGNQEDNKRYLNDSSSWSGKLLTVKFQGITEKSGVPRFPVGLRVRVPE